MGWTPVKDRDLRCLTPDHTRTGSYRSWHAKVTSGCPALPVLIDILEPPDR
jgi:hypothetical protein